MSALCPDIQIIHNNRIIDRHIKYTETFTIGRRTPSRTVPRFGEIQFYPVNPIC